MKERVVVLEAQQPHINAALIRIEGSVDKLVKKIGNAMLALAVPFVALFAGLVFKMIMSGALNRFL